MMKTTIHNSCDDGDGDDDDVPNSHMQVKRHSRKVFSQSKQFLLSGYERYGMESWMLQNQSVHSEWTKVLYSSHAGSASNPVNMILHKLINN